MKRASITVSDEMGPRDAIKMDEGEVHLTMDDASIQAVWMEGPDGVPTLLIVDVDGANVMFSGAAFETTEEVDVPQMPSDECPDCSGILANGVDGEPFCPGCTEPKEEIVSPVIVESDPELEKLRMFKVRLSGEE